MHDDHPCAHSPPQVSSTKCRAGYRADTRQTFFLFSFFLVPFFFFFFFSFSLLGCSESDFFGLNCCTISCNISDQKINFLSRLGREGEGGYPLEASLFLFFFDFSNVFDFVLIF